MMAVRKSLFTPLDASDLSDFLLPLRVVMAGYRNVYEADAVCFEHATANASKEFERKVRIVNRAWRATMKVKAVLNPLEHGWFAVQVLFCRCAQWSHPRSRAAMRPGYYQRVNCPNEESRAGRMSGSGQGLVQDGSQGASS